MQTKEKRGISLVVLTVTIIVLAILVTLIPITIVNVVNNAKLATFIKDLEQIQDAVDEYVVTNGSFEGIGITEKTQTELLGMVVGSDNKTAFISDLVSNLDYDTHMYLFDYNDQSNVIGEVYRANGARETLAGWAHSDYIEIPEGITNLTYSTDRSGGLGTATYATFFTADKTFISGVIQSPNPVTLRVPSNAKYVIVNYFVSDSFYWQLETGTSTTPYQSETENRYIEIDLAELGVESTTTGLGTLGAADKYYVSVKNQKVYYPYGKKIGGDVFFSLTSRLTGKSNINENETSQGEITISPTDDTIITRLSTLDWSNNIDITVDTDLATGEYLRYTIGNATDYTTRIDTLPAIINLSNETMQSSEKIPWTSLNNTTNIENRKITIERMNASNEVISSKIVRVDNLDVLIPVSTSSTITEIVSSTQKQGEYNIITIPSPLNTRENNVGCGSNQIKEIRYEYVNKIDDNGSIVPYYANNPTISKEYIMKFGKVSTNMTLKIPEDVIRIAIYAVDKAGNCNYIHPNLFINCARRKSINWNTEYAKYTQDYFGRNINTMASCSLNRYCNPIIPAGFRPVNVPETENNPTPASWDMFDPYSTNANYSKGLVIEDRLGNQFVWVPVTSSSINPYIPYAKWCTQGDVTYNDVGLTNGTLPIGVADEMTQITNFGGFYVARYEAAFDYNGGNIRAKSIPSINVANIDWSATRTSAYNGYLFNCVNPVDAKIYAERMVNTPYVKSGLITGTAYDTVMKWATTTTNNNISSGYIYDVNSSTAWGNFYDSTGNAAVNPRTIRASGYNQWWKMNNIYDIAGNTWEITNETHTDGYIARGGSAEDNEIGASYRAPIEGDVYDGLLTFRTMLFIVN